MFRFSGACRSFDLIARKHCLQPRYECILPFGFRKFFRQLFVYLKFFDLYFFMKIHHAKTALLNRSSRSFIQGQIIDGYPSLTQ